MKTKQKVKQEILERREFVKTYTPFIDEPLTTHEKKYVELWREQPEKVGSDFGLKRVLNNNIHHLEHIADKRYKRSKEFVFIPRNWLKREEMELYDHLLKLKKKLDKKKK